MTYFLRITGKQSHFKHLVYWFLLLFIMRNILWHFGIVLSFLKFCWSIVVSQALDNSHAWGNVMDIWKIQTRTVNNRICYQHQTITGFLFLFLFFNGISTGSFLFIFHFPVSIQNTLVVILLGDCNKQLNVQTLPTNIVNRHKSSANISTCTILGI